MGVASCSRSKGGARVLKNVGVGLLYVVLDALEVLDMRALRRHMCTVLLILSSLISFLEWHACLLRCTSSSNAAMQKEKGRSQNIDNFTRHFESLSHRPLLVRFKWYSRKNTPIHVG